MKTDRATKGAVISAIQKLAKTYNRDIVEIINCTVLSVDKVKRTCIVEPISGQSTTKIEDVGLMPEFNDGEFKIPSIGSTVGVVKSTMVDPYIISWSDLDEWYLVIGATTIDVLAGSIKLGDGSYEGLVKVVSLTSKLNNLEAKVNALVTYSALHVHSGVTTGPGVSGPAVTPVTGALTPTIKSEIQNENITHGTTT